MRLFAALPLPAETRLALAAAVNEWRRLQWPLRWVAPEAMHVTLRFLGEVAAVDEPQVSVALDESARGTGWIDLVPTAFELHPARRRPRVLWLALEPVPALELLAHRLEQALAPLGFSPAADTFRPHVTLGRVARDARLPADVTAHLAGTGVPAAFGADRLVLYQSDLGGGPPRYQERHAVELVHMAGGDPRSDSWHTAS